MLHITFFVLSILFVFHYQSICKKTFLSRLKHLKKTQNKFTVRLIQIKNTLRWESFKQTFSLLQAYFLLTLVVLHAWVGCLASCKGRPFSTFCCCNTTSPELLCV